VADLVLAVDIGGTKMAAGLVALDGSLVERAMQPTRTWLAPEGDGGGDGKGAGDREGEADAADLLWGDLADLVKRVTAGADGGDRVIVCGAG
jgi:hypothetical protein